MQLCFKTYQWLNVWEGVPYLYRACRVRWLAGGGALPHRYRNSCAEHAAGRLHRQAALRTVAATPAARRTGRGRRRRGRSAAAQSTAAQRQTWGDCAHHTRPPAARRGLEICLPPYRRVTPPVQTLNTGVTSNTGGPITPIKVIPCTSLPQHRGGHTNKNQEGG